MARNLVKGKRVGDIFNKRRLVESLIFNEIDGPTYLGYADTVAFSSRELAARLLGDSEREDFERFRAAIRWDKRLDDRLAWGQPVAAVYVNGQIASAAGYQVLDNRIARVGVVTRAEFRQRRFASACVVRIAQEATEAGLILEYQTEQENSASMALARRLGFTPFAEKIFITFKDSSPNPEPSEPHVKLSTPTQTINEILQLDLKWEVVKEKHGETATADARAVADAILALPWYGSSYQENRSRFESECRRMFPWISDEAIGSLHSAYASGWIP